MADHEVCIDIPKPHFTIFEGNRDGKFEVIVVNDALLAFAYPDVFAWHLCVTLVAEEVLENGMPSPEESELLFRIGEEIEATVLSGRTERHGENALFLARSTWNASRDLLFQVHDPEIAHVALQRLLNDRAWKREWDYWMEKDPEWTNAAFVFQLFPNAQGLDG